LKIQILDLQSQQKIVACHHIIISYHRTCYGATPPELNSALHT